MSSRFAYLANGRLFLKNGNGAGEIESPFGQSLLNSALEVQRRNEWKSQDKGGIFSGRTLWGGQQDAAGVTRPLFVAVSHGETEGSLAYFLQTSLVGAFLYLRHSEKVERRIFHKEAFRGVDLSRHPECGVYAFAMMQGEGTQNIVVMDSEGARFREVTEGDSVDAAPSWVRGQEFRLVYQSAGIGRGADGHWAGMGPASIEEADIDSGSHRTLVSADAFDHLLPRVSTDGSLYFIRRPYEVSKPPSWRRALLDGVLFPVRLMRAFLFFLNVFSMMFSKKPLLTSAGDSVDKEKETYVMLRGKYIDAKTAQKQSRADKDGGYVPSSWHLVRRMQSGEETVLAKGVAAYDLDSKGGVIFTNGSSVWRLDQDGSRELLHRDKIVQEILALD